MDSDSPVLWIRVDADMRILRELKFEQPDTHWALQLRHERDVCAQLDAVDALSQYANLNTKACLTTMLENGECFYRVRVKAASALSQVANKLVHATSGPPWPLIATFKKLFFAPACPNVVCSNNFGDLQLYLVQKSLAVAMGSLRDKHSLCPSDVIRFLLDLIKYNENSRNAYSDSYYRAALIDAIGSTISASTVASALHKKSAMLTQDTRLIVEEVVLRLNLEKVLPTHRYVITVACLRALRSLQRLGHIHENVEIFKQYADYRNTWEDVRLVAFELIIEYLEGGPLFVVLLNFR